MEIKEIKDLKTYLSPEWLLDGKQEIADKFNELAHFILEKTAIQKGDKLYFINDIEFYFYSDNHRDIITYPRNCEAGQWFFHPSGVDIAFESNVKFTVNSNGTRKAILNKYSKFGGILLRGISFAYPEELEDETKIKLDGPMKVMDALFDKFDAFDTPHNFPMLVPRSVNVSHNVKFEKTKRVNLLPSGKETADKVKSIHYNYESMNNFTDEELEEEFNKYLKAPYRFVLSDKIYSAS